MAKIIKNNTGSAVSIDDAGVTVPASGQYTIQTTDDLLFAGSSDVVTLVGDATLTVNDGTNDLTISDGIDLIKGLFPSSVELATPTSSNALGSSDNPIVTTTPVQYRSAFGDVITDSLTPVAQMSAVYGLTEDVDTFTATGGTVDTTDGMFECKTGTSIGGYGVIRSHRSIVYREGQGLMGRFTAIFDGNAVANSLQGAGLFNLTDTCCFGYRGTNFGIIFDTYGNPEIRTLTITTSGNGTLTLTLDGTAYNIPITTGTVQRNATEIEQWLNANQTVWNAEQDNDKVILQARDTSSRNGTYSVSGAGLAGTFSQQTAGNAKTESTVAQTSWDNNPSWFDPDTPNVYMIKISYLGFGPIKFFIMNSTTGEFELVHTIKFIGTATKPSLSKRSLKIGWFAASLGSTTALTVKGASAGVFIEGISKTIGENHSVAGTNASVGSDFVSIASIRPKLTFNNEVMLGRIVLLLMIRLQIIL
jgi:hypothetical protein